MDELKEEDRSIYYQAFTRDDFKCVFCDRDILESFDSFAASHLDHLKPSACGGPDGELVNRVTSCYVCNSLKGAFDPSPDGPVTADNFDQAIAAARSHINDKRTGIIPCSYFRDYEYWVSESGRDF